LPYFFTVTIAPEEPTPRLVVRRNKSRLTLPLARLIHAGPGRVAVQHRATEEGAMERDVMPVRGMVDDASAPLRGVRTTLLCVMVQAVGGGLGWSILPPLMPTIAKDLGISHATGGLVWGSAPLGIALAAPLGGAAVDRFGPRRVAGAALVAGAFACAARAWAVGPWSLALAMFAFGLHIGFCAPAIPKALAGHVPLSKLARANGVALVGYTLGTAVTVALARTVIAPACGGWRPTMVVAAVAMAVAAAVWTLAARDRKVGGSHAPLADALRLARNTGLLRVAAMHFLLFGGYLALLGMLPRALTDRGMPPTRVGLAVACWLAAAGIANYVGPWISDKIGRRRPILVGGAAIAGTALLAMAVAPPSSGTVLLVIAALGGGCVAPLLFALPAELEGVGPARVGAALGLLMLVGQLGGFLLPALSGAIAQGAGIGAALGVLAVAHLAILAPALGLRETRGPAAATLASPAASAPSPHLPAE
jgi:AAHS family benzoate transporter-like MFS transporter